METDVDVGGQVVEDPIEDIVVTANVLDIDDAAEEEEGADVRDAVKVAEDIVGRGVAEELIEEIVVRVEELNIEDAAEEEEEGDAVDTIAEDPDVTGRELERDDTGG